MAESTKRTLDISVPADEVAAETERVVAKIQKQVRLPGFRPGKAPAEMIRKRFAEDVRRDVLDSLLPKHFRKRAEEQNLQVVGSPDVTDVQFEPGQPLRFKVEFEVSPEIELQEYRGLNVAYREPEVTDADVEQRLEELRNEKAEYVNVDPRAAVDGDHVLVSLESVAGVEGQPISQEEMAIHLGGADTFPAFSENIAGMSPGDSKEIEVVYPEDYGQPRLAGRTVRFRVGLKMIRRKELPELNDEFARDLGDFQTLEELRAEVRKGLMRQREQAAQEEAKGKLVDKLVEMHDVAVPEAFVERQIDGYAEQLLRSLVARGVDPRTVRLDIDKFRESQRDKAVHDVKASLLLDRIGEREAIVTTVDEVDREVQRIARQEREPVAAVRMRLEKDGTLRRIASSIRTAKILSFLFEQARKEAAEN